MAKYTSRFKELAFYVNGERKQFINGAYETTDKAEDSVLDALSDATPVKVVAPIAEATKPAVKTKPASKSRPSGK